MDFKPVRDAAAAAILGATLQAPASAQQGPSAPTAPTLVGHTVAEAQAGEFVGFFHLALLARQADPAHPGNDLVMLGSTGQFKGVATLLLVTKSGDDTVQRAGLMLRRDFIDGARTGVFARDIGKSFLEATTGRAAPEVQALHAHLWTCRRGDEPACQPDAPASRTWLGTQDKHRIEFDGGYVMLQNTVLMQVPMLFIENGPA